MHRLIARKNQPHQGPQALQDVVNMPDQRRPVADDIVTAFARQAVDSTGDGETSRPCSRQCRTVCRAPLARDA